MARKRCGLLLEQVKLEDKAEFFVDGLSRGMKQRLCLARALIHEPDLLILDEPASGLDPRTRVEYTTMLKELRGAGENMMVSSHMLVRSCRNCVPASALLSRDVWFYRAACPRFLERVNSSNPLLISIFSNKEKALAILKSHPCVQTISVKEDEIKRLDLSVTGRTRRCYFSR